MILLLVRDVRVERATFYAASAHNYRVPSTFRFDDLAPVHPTVPDLFIMLDDGHFLLR